MRGARRFAAVLGGQAMAAGGIGFAKLAFGQPVETQYKLDGADVIVSLDADFLYAGFPGFTRYARDYAKDPVRHHSSFGIRRLHVGVVPRQRFEKA